MTNLNKPTFLLHVLYKADTNKFEVGYYDQFEANKELNPTHNHIPKYETRFMAVREFETIEEAEQVIFDANLSSTVLLNSIESLQEYRNAAISLEEQYGDKLEEAIKSNK